MKKKQVILSWYLKPKVRAALEMAGVIDYNGKIIHRGFSDWIGRIVLDKLMTRDASLSPSRIKLKMLRDTKASLVNKFQQIQDEINDINRSIEEMEKEFS